MTLSEEELELIHAALDGELTVEQHQRLADLLSQSPAARKYYSVWRKFQKRLRAVDPPPPPQELFTCFPEFAWSPATQSALSQDTSRRESASGDVAIGQSADGLSSPITLGGQLNTLSHCNSFIPKAQVPAAASAMPLVSSVPQAAAAEGTAARRHPYRRRRLVSGLVLAAVAFSVLVATAWLFNSFQGQTDPEASFSVIATAVDKTTDPRNSEGDRPHQPSRSGITDRNSALVKSHTPGESPDRLPAVPSPEKGVAQAPPPREAPLDIFTAPLPPPVSIDMAEIRLPFLRMLGEFDREDVQLAFLQQVQRESAVRIDLFTRDLARGVQWLQKAANQAGLHLAVDATTADRLKKGAPITAVVLYCDNLTPAELTRFFLLLHGEDAKISPRLFDMVHLMPLSPHDERDLREVLGVDPGLNVKVRSDKSDNKGVREAPQRPLSAGTADEIIRSLLAKKSMDKSGLVTTWAPPAARTAHFLSAEIKSYLARKASRSPQAVPALIILRLPNNP
ncbi:MAG: hypothetical protein WHU94_03090 [Thermogemmata sp.]|uniref:Uncharacterized protein n=1 Tax=Thermogemmata fonticola TaxID=2755323 RepID=A0A7V9AAY6_9BACT|nr:hypothetical protein [Thermogemmata fonticola]MBA2225498.1 hypothetical protein [Thermogemmata fonticola]